MNTKKKAEKIGVSADPWEKMDVIMGESREPMGPEWITVRQFAQRYAMREQRAMDHLKRLVAGGRAEVWRGTARQTSRTTCKFRVL
jgi:hypothetical protein